MFKTIKSEAGFSLVEVLITIVLMGVLSISILSLFSTIITRQRQIDATLNAINVCQMQMEQLIADKKLKGFDFLIPENYTNKKVNVFQELKIEEQNPHLKKVVVLVKLPKGLDSLVTYVGDY